MQKLECVSSERVWQLSMSVLCLKFHVFRDTVQQVEVLIQLGGELLRELCGCVVVCDCNVFVCICV